MRRVRPILLSIAAVALFAATAQANWVITQVKGIYFAMKQVPGDTTFTLMPSPSYYNLGNVRLRIIVRGCTFDQFKSIMEMTDSTNAPSISAPGYAAATGFSFSMKLGEYFETVYGQPLRIRYFANIAPGAQTDVALTLNNGVLEQASVFYGRPAYTNAPPTCLPTYPAGAQGKVTIASDTSIGIVNVIGGTIDSVTCSGTVPGNGSIGAVYCRKVRNNRLGFTYGGVIGSAAAKNNVQASGGIGIVMANNGLGSTTNDLPPFPSIGRVVSGWNGSIGTPRDIGCVYLPAGSTTNSLLAAGMNPATIPPTLYMGTVRNIVIGNRKPTTLTVLSNFKPQVRGPGQAASVGNVYTSMGVFRLIDL